MSQIKKQVGQTFGERRTLTAQKEQAQQPQISIAPRPKMSSTPTPLQSSAVHFKHPKDTVKVNQFRYSEFTQRANQKIGDGLNLGGKSPVTDEIRLRFLDAIIGKKV